MDRFDRWLNRQRGWRLSGWCFLSAFPAALIVTMAANLAWRFSSMAPSAPGTIAEAAAMGIPVAAALCLLSRHFHKRATRRALNSGRSPRPLLSWRESAASLFLSAAAQMSMLAAAESPPWQRRHHGIFIGVLIALAGSAVLALWDARYARDLRR